MKPFTTVAIAVLLASRFARADEDPALQAVPPAPAAPPPPVPAALPPPTLVARPSVLEAPLPFPAIAQGAEPTVTPGHWSTAPSRPFISLRFDLGYLYLKPRFSFGYGKPFSSWAGLDLLPFISTDSTGVYSGLRFQLEWFELRAGPRFVHSFERDFLTPEPSYTLADIYENTGRSASYVDLEAEAAAAIPAGPGSILALATAESVQFVPAGFDVFDETLHVVVSPPSVYRARLGYSLILGKEKNGRLGVLAEDIELPGRGDRVIRAGLAGSFDIDDHLQLVATVLIPVYGPDSLGLLGADYTELGIRYRWASGHSRVPKEMIPASAP